ncbi:MAG: hypothetical protein KJ804_20950 [Proteobacteria bacterium]|nr:hypothetical protein [Pseudomonadota bacterium]MBU1060778.1 hypothetical protein [Pseudomonadota bacterium]
MDDTIVFVYNADSGLFNALSDSAHKIFSPETYECNLCAITHSALGMKTEWKEFLNSLATPLQFMHRDELKEKYDLKVSLPAIFRKTRGEMKCIITAEQINGCATIADLKELLGNFL